MTEQTNGSGAGERGLRESVEALIEEYQNDAAREPYGGESWSTTEARLSALLAEGNSSHQSSCSKREGRDDQMDPVGERVATDRTEDDFGSDKDASGADS